MRDEELSAYVAGRWAVVVRVLVLLGAPPSYADELAVTAAGRFLARLSGGARDDEWLDLDEVLLAETVETWEDDRTPWWQHPGDADSDSGDRGGLGEALAALDVLTPAARARVVAAAVAGLSAEQLDEVLGPDAADGRDRWVVDPEVLALLVPVGEPRLAAAWSAARRPARRSRALTVAGLALGLAVAVVAVVVGLRSVDPEPAEPSSSDPPATTVPGASAATVDRAAGRDGGLALAWYDGAELHLADRTVRLPGVVALARVEGGVVATDDDGRVAQVRDDGTVVALGRTPSPEQAVASGRIASWVDAASGEVVVQVLGGGADQVAVGAGAEVAAVDGNRVHVRTPAGPVVVTARPRGVAGLRGASVRRSPLLDVASEVYAVRRSDGLVAIELPDGDGFQVAGDGAVLSDDGRLLAVRSGTAFELVDVTRRTSQRLPLPEDVVVVDAAFDPDGALVLAVGRGPSQVPDGFGSEDARPGYDLLVCTPTDLVCRVVERTYDVDRVPVLAR